VLSTPDRLSGASDHRPGGGEAKGPKINGFTYKNKSNQRRSWGHRPALHDDRDQPDLQGLEG